MSSLLHNPKAFVGFLFSSSISRDSAFYFLKGIMLISFVGTQTRTIMGVGSVTFPSKRLMIDQYVLFMTKSKRCNKCYIFSYYFWRLRILFHPNGYAY